MAASLVAHAAIAVLLAGAGLYAAGAALPRTERLVVSLYQPSSVESPPPPSVERHATEPVVEAPSRAALRQPPPPPVPSRTETRDAPPVPPRPEPTAERAPEPTPERVAPREIPPPAVRTGAFDSPAPTREPSAVPEGEIRQGTFDALAAPSRGGNGVPVLAGASVGAFDVEPGPAKSGRSASGRWAEPTLARAGFDGVAPRRAANVGATPASSEIRSAGFGDSVPVATSPRPRPTGTKAPDQPVEIVSKPRPEYTEEARRLRVEGDVVLEVLFGASGTLRVLRVLRGLGHGLDEAAIEAAGRISFRPARRNGFEVDHRATLRVVFQLAY